MKRYTAPFQKLQLLVVYSALSTMMGASLLIACTQAWIAGDGWLVAAIFTIMMAVPVCAAISTYRELRKMLPAQPADALVDFG
ncbi:hypothetical protein ACYSUW_15085 [Pseudomonas frederiksbergensis]